MEHILSTRVLLAVLNGLEAEARGGAPVCLAIVNCGGGLAALLTMDGTPERAVSIAQGKAYTALRMESSTKDFHERLLRERITIADFCDPAFTTLEGGWEREVRRRSGDQRQKACGRWGTGGTLRAYLDGST